MSKLTDLFNEVYYNKLRPDKSKPSNSSSSNNAPKKNSYVIKVKNKRKFHNEMRRSRKKGYRFLQRSGDRLHSSSYWFDFSVGNFRTILIVFMLFIGFYMVVMSSTGDISNINPFETGISILQEFSKLGFTAKENMIAFAKSIESWGSDSSSALGNIFGSMLTFSPYLTKIVSSVAYSLKAIFEFLKFIFGVITLILRLLLGVL